MPANKAVSTGQPPAPVATERKRALRLHGTIARDIGTRIVSGRISPGRILSGEIEASARLRVSRTAYRSRQGHDGSDSACTVGYEPAPRETNWREAAQRTPRLTAAAANSYAGP